MKASYDYYGRITVDYQSLSRTNAGTKTDIANNESRLGLKGNFALGNKYFHHKKYELILIQLMGKREGMMELSKNVIPILAFKISWALYL